MPRLVQDRAAARVPADRLVAASRVDPVACSRAAVIRRRVRQVLRVERTMLARAQRMPTVKIAVPKTKTWGGIPTRVAE